MTEENNLQNYDPDIDALHGGYEGLARAEKEYRKRRQTSQGGEVAFSERIERIERENPELSETLKRLRAISDEK